MALPPNSASPKFTAFLMTEKGYTVLRETTQRYRDLYDLIVVGKDSLVEKDFEKEIIEHCIDNNLPFIRRADFQGISSEYAMAISWKWLIQHPEDKLIVFHDSLLPRYRGFAPLPNALINGEKEIGVTALYGAKDFDTGPIIAQSSSRISYPIKIADAIDLVIQNYLEVVEVVLSHVSKDLALPSMPQEEKQASYSVWRDEEDYAIEWGRSAAEISRFIDAVGTPYKGASARVDQEIVRIDEAMEVPDVKLENRQPGKVLFIQAGLPVVICGEGLLKITRCSVNGSDFLPLKKIRTRFK